MQRTISRALTLASTCNGIGFDHGAATANCAYLADS